MCVSVSVVEQALGGSATNGATLSSFLKTKVLARNMMEVLADILGS